MLQSLIHYYATLFIYWKYLSDKTQCITQFTDCQYQSWQIHKQLKLIRLLSFFSGFGQQPMPFLATQRKAHFLKASGTGGKVLFSVPLFWRAAIGLDLTAWAGREDSLRGGGWCESFVFSVFLCKWTKRLLLCLFKYIA